MPDNDILKRCTKAFEDIEELLDLANRQKAEIERYLHSIKLLEKDVAQAKSEAYREFAHMVVDKAENGIIYAMDIPLTM